tara:strand:+ start:134 stop:418 length:285 start_codon:yes stop_codon:yes gene_type:complete
MNKLNITLVCSLLLVAYSFATPNKALINGAKLKKPASSFYQIEKLKKVSNENVRISSLNIENLRNGCDLPNIDSKPSSNLVVRCESSCCTLINR